MKGLAALLVVLAVSMASISILPGRVPTAYASSQPLAVFDWSPCEACAVLGDLFFFNAASSVSLSGPIVLYAWDFGDGTVAKSTSPQTSHDYPPGIMAAGVNVTLTVQDSVGQVGSVRELIMFQTVPSFIFSPIVPAIGQKVTFDASSSITYNPNNPILGYDWDFGDGSTGSGVVASHVYATTGIYRVSLTLSTPAGKPSTANILRVGNLIIQTTFDHVNVTITGSFSVNASTGTFNASLTVDVVNSTTGGLIFSKSFTISVKFGPLGMASFVLALPTSSYALGISCSGDLGGAGGCFVSKNPDVNNHGTVDFTDISAIAFAFGSVPGSPRWNASADLNADGRVDFLDVSMAAIDYTAPVFS